MDATGHELMSSRGHEQMRGGSFPRLVIHGNARALAPIRIAAAIGSTGTARDLPRDRARITGQAKAVGAAFREDRLRPWRASTCAAPVSMKAAHLVLTMPVDPTILGPSVPVARSPPD